MIETIQINWLLLIAPFLWVLATAIVIALLGLMKFFKTSKGMKPGEFIKKPLFKIGIIVSAGLIIAGLILSLFRIPSDNLIAVKVKERERGSRFKCAAMEELLSFSPGELKMNRQNKTHRLNNEGMKDNTMVLFWDGFIRTPFIQFKPGDYRVEFRARGSKAKEEYSKVKIEFEISGEKDYLVTQKVKYIELSGRMADYGMDFQVKTGTIGRIRVIYFNDLYVPETREGRDVWLRDIKIKKVDNVE